MCVQGSGKTCGGRFLGWESAGRAKGHSGDSESCLQRNLGLNSGLMPRKPAVLPPEGQGGGRGGGELADLGFSS